MEILMSKRKLKRRFPLGSLVMYQDILWNPSVTPESFIGIIIEYGKRYPMELIVLVNEREKSISAKVCRVISRPYTKSNL
tara:strand:- start:435 stop:674 length:240 start_codon:yes stop_codon:yes gene_type:complete